MNSCIRKRIALTLSAAGVALLVAAAAENQVGNKAPFPRRTNPNPNSKYREATKDALVSGTEATNYTEAEVSALMNESIKTNLAAKLWHRQLIGMQLSSHGANIATSVRVLQSLRAGQTEDAIQFLENDLDNQIVAQGIDLQVAEKLHGYSPTPQARKAVLFARDYRTKYPHKSEDPETEKRVADTFAAVDK